MSCMCDHTYTYYIVTNRAKNYLRWRNNTAYLIVAMFLSLIRDFCLNGSIILLVKDGLTWYSMACPSSVVVYSSVGGR